jgi:anti-sigma factor RsiW
MGTLHPRPLLCERTRAWGSLDLDGELSDFERVLMQSHLDRCAACAAFVSDIGTTTLTVRGAVLEPLPHLVALPTRSRRFRAAGVMRLGAVAGVVVGALGLAGSLTIDPSGPEPAQIEVRGAATDQQNDRLLRVAQRTALIPPPLPDRGRKVLTLPL